MKRGRLRTILRRLPKELKRTRYYTQIAELSLDQMEDLEIISFLARNESLKRHIMHNKKYLTYDQVKQFIQIALASIDHQDFIKRIKVYHEACTNKYLGLQNFFKYIFLDLEEAISDIDFYDLHRMENKEETYDQYIFPSPFVMPVDSWLYRLAWDFFYYEPTTKSLLYSHSLNTFSFRKKLKRISEEGIIPVCLT